MEEVDDTLSSSATAATRVAFRAVRMIRLHLSPSGTRASPPASRLGLLLAHAAETLRCCRTQLEAGDGDIAWELAERLATRLDAIERRAEHLGTCATPLPSREGLAALLGDVAEESRRLRRALWSCAASTTF